MMTARLSPLHVAAPAGRISAMILLRLALAVVASFTFIVASLAADRPALKGDIVVTTDALTLGDLVDGVPAAAAARTLFRAPALGETGTIQVRRIVDAARHLGVSPIETAARTQIVVTRAARRLGAGEIETAVKRALASQHGVDLRTLSITFDGAPPFLVVARDFAGQIVAEDVAYDRRTRRIVALVSTGANPAGRTALRVAGTAVETVDVLVLTRALNRGETAQASDFVVEKRAKETVPSDVHSETQGLAGRVARRSLHAGSVVRAGDLARPEIVARGEVVMIVYEVPGMVLTLRGRASDAGAQGDTISVVNPQSKKTLQAQVVAPGKVSVSGALPGALAVNIGGSRR